MSLTERETEIVFLCAEDLANKEIAARLGISIKTVEFHRNNIRRECKVLRVSFGTRSNTG